ncbi:MAG TPA: hypothetical protein VNX88_19545 [Terriglobales bacterium]|nr:hypothetical protein [Terriglobales bacterium]
MIRWSAVVFALASTLALGQSPESGQYRTRFENDVVAVYELNLPARASASTFQSAHDTFWLSLTDSTVAFARQQWKVDLRMQAGDTRFFSSFETSLVTNTGATDFRGVMVALKPRGLVSSGCECSGSTARTVCGCKGATHLEPLWAVSLGEVTLAGTLLGVGESFRAAALRDDMLLVAVTDVSLTDLASQDSDLREKPVLHVKSGDAVWISAGRHQFKNVGDERARFVTFEF